jgi:cell division protease FtsH
MRQHQLDHARCAALAAEMLGAPVRAVILDREMETVLRKRGKLEARRGTGCDYPTIQFQSGDRGHEMALGAELYRLDQRTPPMRVVRVIAPRVCESNDDAYQFWAVAKADYRRLYGLLRRAIRRRQRHNPPLMHEEDKRRLWANSIGFLMQTQHRLREFGVPAKRGVLLLGEPGNGKTMACRWLRWHCNRRGLGWRNVTVAMFQSSRREGETNELFDLERPGIIFFDDVDMAIRQRSQWSDPADTSAFLGGLDGLDLHHGVVYIFTTNATVSQLDSAFLRPGRIDVVLEFRRPHADLRRKFIEEHWHAEILAAIDVDLAVAQSDGLSFAELDELKRLLVLWHLETQRWDWARALSDFRHGRGKSQRSPIGFQAALPRAPCGSNHTEDPVTA